MQPLRGIGEAVLRSNYASTSRLASPPTSSTVRWRLYHVSSVVRQGEKEGLTSSNAANTEALHDAHGKETEAEEVKAELTSTKYLDALLQSPDAFHRDDELRPQAKKWESRVSPTVLNGPMYQRAQQELNQEWDLPDSGSSKSTSQSPPSAFGAMQKQRKRREGMSSSLTPEELQGFDKLFQEILHSDFAGKAKQSDKSAPQKFAGTLEGRDRSQQVGMLWAKTSGQRQKMKARDQDSRTLYKDRFPASGTIALIHERIAASGMTEADIASGIDHAKEQLQMCQTQDEVWNWALKNVWPIEEAEQGAIESVTGEDAVADEAPFGLRTPLYAPVLHILLKELRDRFRAPHAALSILQIARDLSPESAVLGCTSHLYAEAIRTCWTVLRDLQSARDLVLEAKESGILSGAYSERVFRSMSMKNYANDNPDHFADIRNDQLIDAVVESIKYDVQRIVVRADRAIQRQSRNQGLAQTLVSMQTMVKEMSDAIRTNSKAQRFIQAGSTKKSDVRHTSPPPSTRNASYSSQDGMVM